MHSTSKTSSLSTSSSDDDELAATLMMRDFDLEELLLLNDCLRDIFLQAPLFYFFPKIKWLWFFSGNFMHVFFINWD